MPPRCATGAPTGSTSTSSRSHPVTRTSSSSLVRRIRTELDNVRSGYQLTFDTTGYIGNYPIERATASGGADAIFIMGYDYRTGSTNQVGSVAPLSRTGYDIRDTVRAYKARVPASKLILGVPYYGRAWSTNSNDFHATNISGTKYGASTTVVYSTAIGYLAEHGRHYDATEGVAWTAYRRENCTSTYGCVTPWRQLHVDDAQALRAKYDLINSNNLRGAGIWALGYDGTRTELWKAIGDRFAPDVKPPKVGIRNVGPVQPNPAFQVAWTGTDASGIASYDVQVSVNGGSWYTLAVEDPTQFRDLPRARRPGLCVPGARPRPAREHERMDRDHEVAVVAAARERRLRARPRGRSVDAEERVDDGLEARRAEQRRHRRDHRRSEVSRRLRVASRDRTDPRVGGRRQRPARRVDRDPEGHHEVRRRRPRHRTPPPSAP